MNLYELLLTLVRRGWKPWGNNLQIFNIEVHDNYLYINLKKYSMNDLCSIESGFWQFVCVNNLYKQDYHDHEDEIWIGIETEFNGMDHYRHKKTPIESYSIENYKYRLMLSSIQKDSKEKEKFILDNVKLDD